MSAQTFAVPPTETVVHGEGALERLPDLVDRHGGNRVLVVLSSSLAGGEVEARVRRLLGERLAAVHSGVPQHVPRHAVLKATDVARRVGANAVVSVGGGTPVDCAKAVTLCLGAGITRVDQFDEHRAGGATPPSPLPATLVPHVAVPTTLSGGEHTDLFGVTDERTRAKHSFSDPRFAARAVVLDPWVAAGTPAWLWAASGIRAVDHAVEGMLSRHAMPLTDALGAGALELLSAHLPASAADPADRGARTRCLQGSWLAIFGLTSVGVGLSHGIGHQLAAAFDMTHGVTSAIMLPHVVDFCAPAAGPALRRVARALGADVDGLDDDAAAARASEAVRSLVRTLGVPDTITAAGGRAEDLPDVATRVMDDPAIAACPRPVTRDDVLALLRAAM